MWDGEIITKISSLPNVKRIVSVGTICAIELEAEGSDAGYAVIIFFFCLLLIIRLLSTLVSIYAPSISRNDVLMRLNISPVMHPSLQHL